MSCFSYEITPKYQSRVLKQCNYYVFNNTVQGCKVHTFVCKGYLILCITAPPNKTPTTKYLLVMELLGQKDWTFLT